MNLIHTIMGVVTNSCQCSAIDIVVQEQEACSGYPVLIPTSYGQLIWLNYEKLQNRSSLLFLLYMCKHFYHSK